MTRKVKILKGTDPEMFAGTEKDGKLYSLPPYFFQKTLGVPTSDDKKHPVFLRGEGWILHADGRAFEMGIQPSFSAKELYDTIQDCKANASDQILSRFPEHCLPELQQVPTIGWDVERWSNMPEDFFMATEFGCDRDQDAFNMGASGEVIDARLHPEAYAGGHMHLSGTLKMADDPILTTKYLAMTAGLAATRYSDVPKLERARTVLYGVPGRFRFQTYGNKYGKNYSVGVEYRTPSVTWTKSWEICSKVFEWAEIGIQNLLVEGLGKELLPELEDMTARAILNCDQVMAGQILQRIESRI